MANQIDKLSSIAITSIEKVNTLTDANIEKINALEFAGYSALTWGTATSIATATQQMTSAGTTSAETLKASFNSSKFLVIR